MSKDSFLLYKTLTFMLAKKIHFSDILKNMGIEKGFIYGIGKIGQLIISDLNNYGNTVIEGTYDKKTNDSYSILNKSNSPIIITPIEYFEEIRKQLTDAGIDSRRLVSLTQIIVMADYLVKEGKTEYIFGKTKEFLIVGSGFDNKGSQAMAFVSISEIRKRFGDCIIWFLPICWDEIYLQEPYRMITLEDGDCSNSIVREIMPRIAAVIDISGYVYTSEKGMAATQRNLEYLKMAYENKTPYYIMPQSFGPLDFPESILEEMQRMLSYAKIIYAREMSGKKILEDKLNLKNVKLSNDLVMQNKHVNYDDCFYLSNNMIDKDNITGVALVPNFNLLLYIPENELLAFYKEVIEYLLSKKKHINLIPHSSDEQLCKDIYNSLDIKTEVTLFDNSKDCFDFSFLIHNVDYIIASRYHSIVHAYKQGIPCIAIGWADKYQELMELFGQGRFMMDARVHIDVDMMKRYIDDMEISRDAEATIIIQKLNDIQKENCFDVLQEV